MAKKSTPQRSNVKPAPPAPAPKTKRPPDAWIPWALAGVAFILFSAGLGNGLVDMDDHTATDGNPAVRNFALFGHFNLGMYAPVTWFFYGLAYTFGKNSPYAYHLMSAVVHAVNVWLVFRLFQRLGQDKLFAAVTAFFFAVHPIQVEAVSWVAAFSTPLFSLFSLLALNQYTRYADAPDNKKPYWAALGLFIAACLAKSAAVVLPLTLLVIDLWKKRPVNAKNLLEKAPFFAVSLVFGLLTLYSRAEEGHLTPDVPYAYSAFDRGLMVCHSILFYWTKLAVPAGFSIWYPFEKTNGALPWPYWISPLVLTALLYGAWRTRKTFPFVWLGVLFYLSNIVLSLPFATFGTFELRCDRYNYMAAAGMFGILAAGIVYLKNIRPNWHSSVLAASAVLGLFCLYQSSRQIATWKDTLTLMNHAVATTGDNFGKGYLWRGMAYGKAQKIQPALEDFDRAIEKNPKLYEAYKYRGGFLGMQGNYEQSVNDLTVYLTQKPNDVDWLFNRGLSFANLDRHHEAVADFNKVLEINPNYTKAYNARANAWRNLGENAKAEADLAEAARRQTPVKGR
jgi:protein O-mannosyl-transferase